MINYLYNGVQLPALPEWDRETYPYVVIDDQGGHYYGEPTQYLLVAYKTLPTTYSHVYGKDSHGVSGATDYVYSGYDSINRPENWYSSVNGYGACSPSSGGSGLAMRNLDTVIWANYDVLNADGTLYLAASEPVPVTTTAPIDPAAMMMGVLAGKKIAGMRQ